MRLALIALALFAGIASPATAQVFVDPESPTGQEYSIPLERERRQADPSGESRVAPPSSRVAPLFGEGIEAARQGAPRERGGDGSQGAGGNRSDRPEHSDRSRPSDRSDREDSTEVPEAVVAAAQQPGPPSGGIGSTLLIAGVAALVLVVGGIGGLALRRRA